jgi:hypothetical protein
MPFFSKKLEVGPNLWASYSENKSIINSKENKTQDIRSNLNLEFRLNLEKVKQPYLVIIVITLRTPL